MKYIITGLFGIIIVLLILLQGSCNKSKHMNDIYAESTDSLHKTINKLGQEQTTTLTLRGAVSDLSKLNDSKDSTLRKLKAIVDKKTATATVLTNTTSGTISSPTTFTFISSKTPLAKQDSAKSCNPIKIYPTYSTHYKSRWDSVSAIATKDSFNIKYEVYNEFDLKTEWKSGKWYRPKDWFKPAICEASVLNKNPNTKTLEFKTFNFEAPKHNRWIDWVIGAAGATVVYSVIKK